MTRSGTARIDVLKMLRPSTTFGLVGVVSASKEMHAFCVEGLDLGRAVHWLFVHIITLSMAIKRGTTPQQNVHFVVGRTLRSSCT